MPQKKSPQSLNKKLPLSGWSVKRVSASLKKRRLLRKKARAKIQPHRAFRLTSRRDYVRSFQMPGYVGFTHEVSIALLRRWKLFGSLALFYAVLVISLGGITTQENYVQLQDLIATSTGDASVLSGGVNAVVGASTVLLTSLSGNENITEIQQVYLVFALLLVWLTTIWLLRELKAGRRPKLRDGLYNASSPVISTFIVSVILLIQLIPFAVAAIGYAALVSTGLASQGLGSMLAVMILVLFGSLTLYWMTSTFIALVVVTLPGMYPLRAMRAASDLVASRRLRVLYRLLWMLLVALVVWAVVMIPLILFESWLRARNEWLSAMPTVPFLITAMSALTTIWITAYIYLMYRKLVDDNSQPG